MSKKVRTAAGFILANFDDGEPRYLLLRGTRVGDWLPPKGHTDDDEAPLQTALRETEEEAGIREINVVEGFARTIEYDVETRNRGAYHKKVTYLLGTTNNTNAKCSDEHSEARWFTIEEALEKIAFEQMREVMRAADAYLRKQ
ncbi:MAG: NUDIX domain-containing protein [Planctomycetes bacterium]|nr:NUDIX domain-containing protein [Planctomycetota bacterium]